MTAWHGYKLIICNDCIENTLKSTSVRAARREAKALGWHYAYSSDVWAYLDICPACWGKRERKGKQA